jgi:hypothetical protein
MRIHEISESLYIETAENHPQHTIFHTASWLRGLSQAFGTRVKYLGLFENEDLIGVCPLLIKRLYGVTIQGSWLPQHSTPPLYPLIPSGRDAEIIHAFDAWVRENGLSHFQLCWRGIRTSLPPKVRVEIGEVQVVEVGSSCENLWKQIHPRQRNHIRFAVREGVMVHWVRDASFLPTYARLIASTWQERQGLKPNTPFGFYTSLFNQRHTLKLQVMAATYRGRVIAAIWLLHRNGQCCYWDGASDQTYRRLNATHLLQWEAFRWCLNNKIRVYDMGGGATAGREGIVRFKRSLGARPVEHSVLYWQTTTMRLALAGYRWIAHVRNRSKRHGRPVQNRNESKVDHTRRG